MRGWFIGRISRCQRGEPGSIPGPRIFLRILGFNSDSLEEGLG